MECTECREEWREGLEEWRYIQGKKDLEIAHGRAEIGPKGQTCTWNVMDMTACRIVAWE